jgi:hypothetical protein
MVHLIAHGITVRSAGCGWMVIVAVGLLLGQGAPVLSQSQSPLPAPVAPQGPPAAAQEAPPPAPEPPSKPDDFFDKLNRWWGKSASDFKQSVEEQNAKWRELNAKSEKAAKDAATASREAAEAFKNLSNTRMVEGRKVCEIAANGSPDCQTAAELLCRSKGFTTGKSADITTSRKCSIRGMLHRDGSACKVETVMIKAACQ